MSCPNQSYGECHIVVRNIGSEAVLLYGGQPLAQLLVTRAVRDTYLHIH